MKKTFKFRIFPTPKQKIELENTLGKCRWLYNHFLEERKNSWEKEKRGLSKYDQQKSLPGLKEEHPFLKDAFSQVLQNVAVRIDLAFKGFFRRVKSNGKPGYPRFRGRDRYDSFTYPQMGFRIFKNSVRLSKIGTVKAKFHRPIEGAVKTCTVRRTPTGKWYVSFSCEVDHAPIENPVEPTVGIDVGLEHFATLTTGVHIENPRFFRKEEKALAKAQRRLSKLEKGTVLRAKARKVVARTHERIKWKRENFAHQESRRIVDSFNTIVVEDISVKEIQKENFRCVNKSIGDAAWSMFLILLSYKAEWAGKKVVKVNPAYTSQTCSFCGERQKLKLSDRTFNCQNCNSSLQRDHNAAKNILTLGMQGLGKDFSKSLALEAACL